MGKWIAEIIPDDDFVYMRVHKANIKENNEEVRPGAFVDHGGGMSTNWARYLNAQDTRKGANEPEKNGVIYLNVGATRGIDSLNVLHTPSEKNRAHTDVLGEKTLEVRLKLSEIFVWVIKVSDAV